MNKTPAHNHESNRLFVLGLGVTGRSVVQAALAKQTQVSVWDDNPAQRESLSASLKNANTKSTNTKSTNTKSTETKSTGAKNTGASTGTNANASTNANAITIADKSQWENLLPTTTHLVVSPGIPYEGVQAHPLIRLAKTKGVTPISDLELFFRGINNHAKTKNQTKKHKVIAITGTDGKSTTATLAEALLQAAGKHAAACGNLGTAIFDAKINSETIIVLEISSYQIPITPSLAPDAAVLVSLAPDHLDRHGSLENYLNAKRGIFTHASTAIIGLDDALSHAEYQRLASGNSDFTGKNIIAVSGLTPPKNHIHVGVQNNQLVDEEGTVCTFPQNGSFASPHSRLSLAAAWAAVRPFGVPRDCLEPTLHNFQGLPHRFATIAEKNGVRFINDSKATNIHATLAALTGATQINAAKVFWIAGGQAKQQDFSTLFNALPNAIEHGFFIGEARKELTSLAIKTRGKAFAQECTDGLEQAVHSATQAAQKLHQQTGEQTIVLFSPACASFDQFANFNQRGDKFTALVQALLQNREQGEAQ